VDYTFYEFCRNVLELKDDVLITKSHWTAYLEYEKTNFEKAVANEDFDAINKSIDRTSNMIDELLINKDD